MMRARLRLIAGLMAAAVAIGGADVSFAQNAPASSAMKTIGTPSAPAKPEIVPSLFVFNSRGATLQGDTLILTGVTPAPSSLPIARCDPQVISRRRTLLRNGDRAMTALPRILPTRLCLCSARMAR